MEHNATGMERNTTGAVDEDVTERELHTMFTIALLTLLGYAVKRSSIAGARAEAGIGYVLGNIALPCMIFRAIAKLDLHTIEPALVFAALMGKLIVFCVGCLVGALATPSQHAGPGARLTHAGAVSLFVTGSDDLALGLPFFTGVFSPALTHMLFVMSATQMLIVAPPSLLLLGLGRLRREGGSAAASSPGQCFAHYPQLGVMFAIALTILKNRLVVAAFLGLMYNLVVGNDVPWWLDDPVAAIAAAFPPLALMTGGMSLVGASRAIDSIDKLGLPLAVVSVKVLLMPITTRLIALGLGVGEEQSSFAFEYGLLPTAAAAIVIVRQAVGEHHSELVLRLAGAYAISKAVAMVLLLVFAVLLTVPEEEVRHSVAQMAAGLQIASAVSATAIALPVLLVPAMRTRWGFELSELLVLVVMQLGFALSGASFGAASVGEERILQLHGHGARALAYSTVNVCRWAIDGWLLTMCVRLVSRARRAASLSPATLATMAADGSPLREVAAEMPNTMRADETRQRSKQRTLPWVLPTPYPDDPLLPLWILSASQAAACAVAYGGLSAALAACLVALVYYSKAAARKAARARTSPDSLPQAAAEAACADVGSGQVPPAPLSPGPPPTPSPPSKAEGSLSATSAAKAVRAPAASEAAAIELRVGVLCACALIRSVVAMLMCASLAREPTIDGIVAQLLMVLLFFVDGQGLLSLVLYASHPSVVKGLTRAMRAMRARCAPFAMCCFTPAAAELSEIDEYGVMLPDDEQQAEWSGMRRHSRRAHASWRKLVGTVSSPSMIEVVDVPPEVRAVREL